MNTYHVRLLQKHLEVAMQRYCDLCTKSPDRHFLTIETLFTQTKEIILYYIRLFQAVGFLDQNTRYYHDGFCITYRTGEQPPIATNEHSEVVQLMNKAYERFSELGSDGLLYIPIQICQINPRTLDVFIGLVTKDELYYTTTVVSHQTIYPRPAGYIVNNRFRYLAKLLESYEPEDDGTLENFVKSKGLSFRQVQKDSNDYFGSTFHNHYLKTKMIFVLEDLLFGSLSYKEIAYENGFSSYNQLYRLFHMTYNFPLRSVSRLNLKK